MEKNKKRAERRAQKERMLRKALKKAEMFYASDDFEEWKKRWAVRHADNLASCSCHMCGNPRRIWNEPTIQEKKISQRERFCEES